MPFPFSEMQKTVHQNAMAHGFWDGPEQRNLPTKVALIHSEASELLEAIRKHNPPCEKIPTISSEAEELADIVIRCMDYAEFRGIDLGNAILLKHAYNVQRPYKHGGKTI